MFSSRLTPRSTQAPKRSLWQKIKDVALTDVRVILRGGVSADSIDSLEQVLLESDFGVATTTTLVDMVRREAERENLRSADDFRNALREHIEAALRAGNSDADLKFQDQRPTVILVVGVNGAGKTTFVGKLATRLRDDGKKVLVAAADTFRAGAIDQLRVWASRSGADFVASSPGSDPASVAYDAVDAGVTRGADVVIVDTAGRLHTSDGLMEELRKVARVINKRLPGAPHETLLVLDGTIGQNAIAQGRIFAQSVPLSGLVVTKLDGTARGGIVVAVHEALDVPVKFVGVGEGAGDLQRFDPAIFARELLEG